MGSVSYAQGTPVGSGCWGRSGPPQTASAVLFLTSEVQWRGVVSYARGTPVGSGCRGWGEPPRTASACCLPCRDSPDFDVSN